MQPIASSSPKPAPAARRTHSHLALWTSIGALAASAALGLAAPRFAGHAQARPEGAASQTAVPQERSVPSASDMFVEPAGAAVTEAQAPTF